ncbi:hypothetical protein CHLRE_12g495350v5 [Chlamydomonas reinhardtii]|uniref:Ig-like domain-containing protein n=1 Tax=Chlamydomonas reinhardtii TaxID=3055 RepID=A0A2K3D211_CHLRE|nr:uncharacterized protein CHLRE_12g495350v5 [Chlamydomonas reinhardtii]PNW74559.1 hypothetical protein CHLRE_12g495350v5 [Chlamydomonas reinhardtii]
MLQQHAMQQQQLLMQQQAGMPFPQPLPAQVFVGPDGRPFMLPPGTAPPPGAVPAPPEMAAAVLAAQPPAAPAGPPGQVFIGPDGRPFLLPPGMAPPPGAVPAPPEMAAAILAQQPPAPAPAVPMAADPMAAAAAAQAAAMAAAGQVPAAGTGVGAAQAQYVDPQQQAAMLQQQQQQATALGQQQQALLQQQQQQAAAAVQAQAQAAQAQAQQAHQGQQGQQAQQGQGQPMPQPLPPQGAAQPQPFQPQPPPPRPAQALGESVDLTRRGGTGGGSSGGGAPPSRTASIGSVRALGGTAGAAVGSRSGRARMASVPSSSLLELTSAAAAAATTTTGGAAAGAGGAEGQHTGTGVRAAGLTASPAASGPTPAGWGGSVVGFPPASSDPFAMLGPGPNPPRRRFGRAIGEADEDGADGGIPAAGDAAGAPAAATGTAEPAGGARQARRRRAGRLGDDQAGDAAAAGGDPNAAAGAGADPAQAAAAQAAAAAAAAAAAPPGLGILPQEVAKVVPYGTLGAEARMAATGEPPEVPPTTPVHLLPEKFSTSRVFGWQEKVYSRSEIAAAQAAAVAAAQAAGLPLPPGAVTGVTGAPGMPPGMAPPGGPGAPGTDPNNPQQQQQRVNKRMQAFGSSSNVLNKQLDPRTPGSILFTYVQTDEFCDSQELGRAVTTSPYEEENLLVSKLLSNPKGRAQVLTFRSMYVMADLGDEGDVSGANCKVLVSVRVYPDGSFDMCPGFSRPGFKYRFEDDHGGIFEYSVDNASAADVPSLERRAAKLERAVVARAEELRRAALKSDFEPPPPGQCVRLLLLGDILAAADFPRDRLYVEYAVRWDPEAWDLVTAWPQQEPGIVQGVTHISRTTSYPADPARLLPARDVAHLNHPLELEWVSRGGPPPAANKLPAMFFQVCTLDKLNRYTSQGYGWLALADAGVPGAATHRVKTWRPLGTIRDKRNEFFVGGSAELNDLAYLTTPSGFNGRILNKYGFKTESVGALKVRLNTVAQRFNPDAEEGLGRGGRRSRSPSPGRVPLGPSAAAAKRNQKKDMSLKMVVERARQRLREARGDEVPDAAPGAAADVGVRPGLVAEAPTIVVHPQDAAVAEEGTVRFKVVARGLPPLKYEWYRDDRRLLAATADQPELILVQASLENEGAYYCQVSNKDGSVNSSKANLTVTRAARVSRATAGDAAGGEGSGRTPPRPPRNRGASVTSPGSSAGGAAVGGGRVGGARMSRLARLDAAAATPGTRGTSVDGGSEGGVSNTGASDLGAPGGGADLPPLPPPPPQLAPVVTGAAPVPASEAPLPPLPPPAMPPAPGAGAAEGFRKRPPRGPSGSGAAPLPPPAPAAGSEIEEIVREVEEVVEAVPRPIARQGSAAGPAAAPAPAASGPAAAVPPKAAPKAAAAADDLEAEDIE